MRLSSSISVGKAFPVIFFILFKTSTQRELQRKDVRQTSDEGKAVLKSMVASTCPPGYFGYDCGNKCPVACAQKCRDDGLCIACSPVGVQPPDCTKECDQGFYGLNCRLNCSVACRNSRCHSQTGECYECQVAGVSPPSCTDSCSPGTFGFNCGNRCPMSCSKACDPVTGACLKCEYGEGSHCTVNCALQENWEACRLYCSPRCLTFCNTTTATCSLCASGFQSPYCEESCEEGFFGSNCQKRCSMRCKNQLCDPIDGTCHSCSDGYVGRRCNGQCIPGFFGKECLLPCPETCPDGLCHFDTGDCFTCPRGYTGKQCDHLCGAGTHGEGCTVPCPSTCKDKCDPVSGECWQCTSGYFGPFCNESCKTGTYGLGCLSTCPSGCLNDECTHVNGHCLECKAKLRGPFCREADVSDYKPSELHLAIYVTVGVLFPVIALGIAMTCYKYKVNGNVLKQKGRKRSTPGKVQSMSSSTNEKVGSPLTDHKKIVRIKQPGVIRSKSEHNLPSASDLWPIYNFGIPTTTHDESAFNRSDHGHPEKASEKIGFGLGVSNTSCPRGFFNHSAPIGVPPGKTKSSEEKQSVLKNVAVLGGEKSVKMQITSRVSAVESQSSSSGERDQVAEGVHGETNTAKTVFSNSISRYESSSGQSCSQHKGPDHRTSDISTRGSRPVLHAVRKMVAASEGSHKAGPISGPLNNEVYVKPRGLTDRKRALSERVEPPNIKTKVSTSMSFMVPLSDPIIKKASRTSRMIVTQSLQCRSSCSEQAGSDSLFGIASTELSQDTASPKPKSCANNATNIVLSVKGNTTDKPSELHLISKSERPSISGVQVDLGINLQTGRALSSDPNSSDIPETTHSSTYTPCKIGRDYSQDSSSSVRADSDHALDARASASISDKASYAKQLNLSSKHNEAGVCNTESNNEICEETRKATDGEEWDITLSERQKVCTTSSQTSSESGRTSDTKKDIKHTKPLSESCNRLSCVVESGTDNGLTDIKRQPSNEPYSDSFVIGSDQRRNSSYSYHSLRLPKDIKMPVPESSPCRQAPSICSISGQISSGLMQSENAHSASRNTALTTKEIEGLNSKQAPVMKKNKTAVVKIPKRKVYGKISPPKPDDSAKKCDSISGSTDDGVNIDSWSNPKSSRDELPSLSLTSVVGKDSDVLIDIQESLLSITSSKDHPADQGACDSSGIPLTLKKSHTDPEKQTSLTPSSTLNVCKTSPCPWKPAAADPSPKLIRCPTTRQVSPMYKTNPQPTNQLQPLPTPPPEGRRSLRPIRNHPLSSQSSAESLVHVHKQSGGSNG